MCLESLFRCLVCPCVPSCCIPSCSCLGCIGASGLSYVTSCFGCYKDDDSYEPLVGTSSISGMA